MDIADENTRALVAATLTLASYTGENRAAGASSAVFRYRQICEQLTPARPGQPAPQRPLGDV
jgi:hypothetical protein